MGYEFYFRNVPEDDLKMLNVINDAGFDFFKRLAGDDKMEYSITYDFHLVDRDDRQMLINHKLMIGVSSPSLIIQYLGSSPL